MGLVGIIGILACVPALFWVGRGHGPVMAAMMLCLLIMHIAFSFAYMQYTFSSGGDTLNYYNDPLGWANFGFQAGTIFTASLTQILKTNLAGSYWDCFVFFQAFGFWGIAAIAKVFEETGLEHEIQFPNPLYLLLFLPGIHFWTVAIGKDAPLFLGVALAVWSCLRINRRFIAFGFAVLLMYAFRPHVALLACLAVMVSLAIDGKTKPALKWLLLLGGLAMLPAMFAYVQSYVRIDSFSVEGFSNFIERQDRIAGYFEGGADIASASFPVKVFTLLFRPFFFDAGGFMGLVASFENMIWLAVFGYLAFNWRVVTGLFVGGLAPRFAVLFAFGLILILASANYNVGLGLRQKMMVMPAIMYLLYTVMAINVTSRVELRPARQGA